MVESPPQDDDSEESPNVRQWREIYLATESGLRAFLRGRLAQQVDVDDCLQVVFVKLIQQASKPDDNVAPLARRAWLFRVAANEAAALWRRKASTDKMMSRHGSSEDDIQVDATDKVILTESTIRLRQAVEDLPEPMRDVVRLRIEEDLTFQQIADRLEIPLGTALTRMRRALERLKSEINPDTQP